MRMFVSPEFERDFSRINRDFILRRGTPLHESACELLAFMQSAGNAETDPLMAYQLRLESEIGMEDISMLTFVQIARETATKGQTRTFLRDSVLRRRYELTLKNAAAVLNCTPEQALMAAMLALMHAYKTANMAAD